MKMNNIYFDDEPDDEPDWTWLPCYNNCEIAVFNGDYYEAEAAEGTIRCDGCEKYFCRECEERCLKQVSQKNYKRYCRVCRKEYAKNKFFFD